MQALALLLALSIPQDGQDATTPAVVSVADCAVQRLKPFVSPYGIQQAWPVMASPPPEFLHTLGTPLSDMGHIADGYQQFLHIDEPARAVYVVEQGGFAGTTKVYGPLPLPRCMTAPPTRP
ncbi:hypothetical protein [Pseudoxanthomonas sp. PXM02]|uniref:hypothetical protein n=1 Tax=Pseudoxanthomonas sp. PXM02 TaxID=2769294 RepID=UPI00177E578E|nr:hypothetical protein [Pseudoxanthomonas sp. PXM02]MBD9480441.1 hypothetical protein [Pseudoxanthomonas sp. PXM02]